MFNQLYYDKFSKADASLITITNNHLDGIKYIYSDQKSYLSFYDQYNNTQALKIAEQLIDVEGIEYIYKKTKGNYLQFLNSPDKTKESHEHVSCSYFSKRSSADYQSAVQQQFVF